MEKIKSTVEILGIISVVISLFLVWQETQQNRMLAEANFDLLIAQNTILANQTITQYPDIWRRGCANDSLTTKEMTIFRAMIENKNDVAFYRIIKSLRLKAFDSSHSDWADFVGFLHQNPGARKVWMEREESFNNYRAILEVKGANTWYRDVNGGLGTLDKAGK